MAETKTKTSKKTTKKSNNPFKKVWSYLRECKGEIKKITWTHPKVATKNFFVVLVVLLVAGVAIYALDRGLYFGLDKIMAMYSR